MSQSYRVFTLVLGFASFLGAQTTEPTLDEVLARLDENALAFRHHVPNFFCAEHVVSSFSYSSSLLGIKRTVTDTTFRLRRHTMPDKFVSLEESHAVRLIDGKPPTAETENLGGPVVLTGVFSNGLNFVSTNESACFTYKMKVQGHEEKKRITISFHDRPAEARAADCGPIRKVSGLITVDAATYRVLHAENTISRHEILPGVFGRWAWSIDYAPVLLGTQTFWMPKIIKSSATEDPSDPFTNSAGAGAAPTRGGRVQALGAVSSNDPRTWSFVATYSDFHRTTVSARILPGTVTPTEEETPEIKAEEARP
jgi:hypothetical protein